MHCRDIRKKLSAWYDGEKNQNLSCQIQKHLSGCQECSRIMQEILDLKTLFQHYREEPLPEGFDEAVMKQVRTLNENRSEAFQPLLWWRDLTFQFKAFSAVTFSMVLSMGIYMGGSFTPENQQNTSVSSPVSSDEVVEHMMNPFGDTGSETILNAYMALTLNDEEVK